MSKASWRKIVVDGDELEWVVPNNAIDVGEVHLRVRARDAVGQMLLIDPYAWALEIRPKTIAGAIRWSLANGWEPKRRSKARSPMIIAMDDQGQFHVLPKGTRFQRLLAIPLGWEPLDAPPKRNR